MQGLIQPPRRGGELPPPPETKLLPPWRSIINFPRKGKYLFWRPTDTSTAYANLLLGLQHETEGIHTTIYKKAVLIGAGTV